MRQFVVWCVGLASLLCVSGANAQESQSKPNPWKGGASLGLTFTSGNKDTSTLNAGYEVTYDPKSRNIVKSDALFIRGMTDGELSADRLSVNLRDEMRVDGFFLFGQSKYLQDRFKDIIYLVAPTAGVGYAIVNTDTTKLTLDAGVGGVWERNPGQAVRPSGAVTLDQKLRHNLSETAVLTQSISALWKTEDINDALYSVGTSLALSVTARTQIKLEWLDSYKNKPATNLQKNDVSVLIALVFKSS